MAQALEERYGGEVPTELDDLVTLPGRRAQDRQRRALGVVRPPRTAGRHARDPALARLKLTNETDPVKIELDLNGIVAPEERGKFSLRLIEHGRKVCDAKRPRCDVCVLSEICPSAFRVGPWVTKAKTEAKVKRA